MSDGHSDLVIQISTRDPQSHAIGAIATESPLFSELRRCLQPGVEIALTLRGYTAIASILWLSGPLPDLTLRAGVRLLGVSAPPAEESTDQAAARDELACKTVSVQSGSHVIPRVL